MCIVSCEERPPPRPDSSRARRQSGISAWGISLESNLASGRWRHGEEDLEKPCPKYLFSLCLFIFICLFFFSGYEGQAILYPGRSTYQGDSVIKNWTWSLIASNCYLLRLVNIVQNICFPESQPCDISIMKEENVHDPKYREAKPAQGSASVPVADLFRLVERTVVGTRIYMFL